MKIIYFTHDHDLQNNGDINVQQVYSFKNQLGIFTKSCQGRLWVTGSQD